MMKKNIAVILALALLISLAACGAKDNTPETTSDQPTGSAELESDGETEKSTDDAPVTEKKILTVYFSSANTAGVDAVSSATPYAGEYASTEQLAIFIHDAVGGDLAKITPEKDYPEDYNGTADAAKAERDNDERPAFLALEVNPEDYDVIFVGYPMWWYTLPMVMYTFFDTYDFSGKTIVPFNTHAGSGDGGTYAEIAEFEPNATVLDGLAVSGSRAANAQNDVTDWLNGLDY
jgi:flavodoxin